MRIERFGDMRRLEEAYLQAHPESFLLPWTARKPNADEQADDAGDDEVATFA